MKDSTRVVHVDPDAREDVRAAFSGIATVEGVDTLEEGIASLENANADCVVTEYALPDGRGVDLCERIRSRGFDVPVIVFTDSGTEAIAGEAIAAGASGYVPKSEGVDTLVERVHECVEGSAATGAPDSAADRLESLITQSPLAIIEWNLAFEPISWNPAATRLFGYEPEAAIGEEGVGLLVPEDERESVREEWETLLERNDSYRSINRNVRADGSLITCEWFNTPLVDESGEVVSVLSFAQDVTAELKRADALEALQATTNDLMRASSTDEIAELTIAAVDDVIEQPRATVRLHDEREDHLACVAATDQLHETYDEFPPIGPGDGPFWEAYDRQKTIVVDDPPRDTIPHGLPPSENAVLHPLGEHGLLAVTSSKNDALDETDRGLVHVLAATAEAALDRTARELELERAKTLIEAVGDSVFALDTAGRFVTVNDTLVSTTGYSRDRLVGEHYSLVLTDESLDRSVEVFDSLLEADDDHVATYEVTVENRDGDRIPCEVNTSLLYSEGNLDGTVGIVRDISDRKRMEREVADRQRKIEALHDVASRLDGCESEDDIFELAVEAAESVLNFDVCVVDSVQGEYLVKEAISSSLPPSDYFDRTPIDAGIAGKTHLNGETYRIDELAENEDATPECDAFRSALSVPIGTRGVFQAVSTEPGAFDRHDEELAELLLSHVADALDRRAFQETLREERDRFAALFENVPDAVVSSRHEDDEPIVEQVNPAFEQVFGYEEDELVGEPLDRFIVPADREADADAVNRRGRKGEIIEGEVKRRTTNGLRDFMMRIVPMKMGEANERGFGVYTDITEQKQRQKRVEILNRVLRHDLRNGMNIINGCAEMLAAAVEDDANLQYAEAIQERAGELIGLAEKTRAVERTLERGDAATGPVDVIDGVERAIDRVEADFPEANMTYSTPDRAFARADDLLQTAIFHVVENAVQHNDESIPAVDVHVTNSRTEDDELVISITDNGPGIPEEERELLQEEKEITQLRHASGLGLWLVNWVVTQSGGQLTFEENDPRGTVVKLRVPKADVSPAQPVTDGAAAGD